jgi:hypothetical protein
MQFKRRGILNHTKVPTNEVIVKEVLKRVLQIYLGPNPAGSLQCP